MPLKSYKVSARIMIQDGTQSHIHRYKNEMEHNGNIADPEFEVEILEAFATEINAEATQTTLVVDAGQEKPDTKEPEKKTGKKEKK